MPVNSNGGHFLLRNLKDDQRKVAAYIINAIKTYATQPSEFTPIRMNVMGMAGFGETVLVKTLITAV